MKQLLWILAPTLLLALGCNKNDGPDQRVVDEELIENYLDENQLTAERHSSGLYYIIEEPGTGGNPNVNSEVLVKYKGYLLDGTIFDQTPGSESTTFFLYQVIRGWQIGIPLLKKGGKGMFLIPSGLAYGPQPRVGIPANSVLIFETELVDFQ
ncbi:MAG: FKBP-type peptidyl-prolyl cis-trans isomerase [Lewinellaceae bacterium]|nr:FKBP-type peptidyl-prolyl cis-trans isomerase [Lewinellaceae bacterium]